jgi:acetyltransferase-like isoleucine patch superfamily enzyme
MIKKFLRKIILGEKADSESYINHLRRRGAKIGADVRFYSPSHTLVDETFAWLVSIGDHVSIAHGVIILTHDYAWSVIKRHPDYAGRILGAMSPVTIGNNVFIGMNAVITRGVTIGDNVIIGAGSVVTSDCPSDGVYAGNPARRIMSIQQFQEKRSGKQFNEAKTLALKYRERYGTEPPQDIFWEYFQLFSTDAEAIQNSSFLRQMKTGGNFEDTVVYMQNHPPMFDGYEAFLEACDRD